MPVPESAGSEPNPSLFSSLRSFWSVLVSILYTRLDLLTIELEEEAKRTVHLILVSLAGLLFGCMTVFFLMFLLIASFWDGPYRLLVLGIVFGINVLATLTLVLIARSLILKRPKFLSHTLAELRRDEESLRPLPAVKIEEIKP